MAPSAAKARAAFEPEFIDELRRLDKRIEHSKNIISRHLALSSFFDVLEKATLENVQFKSIRLSANPQGSSLDLSLAGLARSYASVALQSDAFGKTEGVKNPIFSQLDLGLAGDISFSVTAILDPEVFKYADFSKGYLMIEKDIFPKLATAGKLAGHKVKNGKWYDCGTFACWEKAIKEW